MSAPVATPPRAPGDSAAAMGPDRLRVCVVGSGTRMLSGISYYTNRMVHALAVGHDVSAVLMRQLIPTRLYPGRERVGAQLTEFDYPAGTNVYDGVDWHWGRSMIGAMRFLRRERPDVVLLQWWTGAVLHTYLMLALVARMLGARVVIEFHEVQDFGEQDMPLATAYVRRVAPLLLKLCHGYCVHNEADRAALEEAYGLGEKPIRIIPHGPYDQYAGGEEDEAPEPAGREPDVCELLYFGVIRPFKGVDDLLEAFADLDDEEVRRFRLTVVGETWEGFDKPVEMIAGHRHRDRITFVNRYVADEEVGAFFKAADAVVLPYHRSSASGPLHLAMSQGLPAVVTAVGGLVEAAGEYEGAIRIPPKDPAAIRAALDDAWRMRGQRFEDPHSWDRTLARFDELFAETRPRRLAA